MSFDELRCLPRLNQIILVRSSASRCCYRVRSPPLTIPSSLLGTSADSAVLARAKHSYNAGRMDFLKLLDGVEYLALQGNPQIGGLDYDSRRVQPGWCFVAIRGETTDGNQYIDTALRAGAVAVVSDSCTARPDVAWAQVPHGRRALARLSANFYGRPAERLSITGITGTNGKTTTAFILNAMLRCGRT